MEKPILERYARGEDGSLVIDVTAGRIEDLYNCYDKSAPYLKKDLEPELVDYLVECVREIGREPFVVRFRLDTSVDGEGMARLKESLGRYFLYLKQVEWRELKSMVRTSLILLAIGVAILTLSVWLHRQVDSHETVVGRVFAEGLTVAAWVSLWESLATFLINWAPHHRKIRVYQRIAAAPLLFGATTVADGAAAPRGGKAVLPGQ